MATTTLKKAAKSRKRGFSNCIAWAANAGNAVWQYGWTHYGTEGQTLARLHTPTRGVEIKDGKKWIRCASGSDAYFTPDFAPS
jgi:hypothetical protein